MSEAAASEWGERRGEANRRRSSSLLREGIDGRKSVGVSEAGHEGSPTLFGERFCESREFSRSDSLRRTSSDREREREREGSGDGEERERDGSRSRRRRRMKTTAPGRDGSS